MIIRVTNPTQRAGFGGKWSCIVCHNVYDTEDEARACAEVDHRRRGRVSDKGALFKLGRVVATPAALDRAHEHGIDVFALLSRHVTGDWGDLSADDAAENDFALDAGDLRILSSYGSGDTGLWIITEADHSSTCILRPEDY